MSSSKPIIYLLYGDDTLAIDEIINTLRDRIGDPSVASMNTASFSAPHLDLAEFETTCSTMPFMAERRLILLEHAEAINKKTPWLDRFLKILSNCPQQTAVVLHASVDTTERRALENFMKKSPLYQWVQDNQEKGWMRRCLIPQKKAFDQWITDRVRSYNGEIDQAAAHTLASMTEGDPLLADHEIRKLLDYTDYSRSITSSDVEDLTPLHGQADIFTLVDAIGNQDVPKALREFNQLQESVSMPIIFSMITRQFRLLIQARDCLDRNLNPDRVLKGHSFVIKKIAGQAQNFTMQNLKFILSRLQEMDYQSKSSSIDSAAALDSFIAEAGSIIAKSSSL